MAEVLVEGRLDPRSIVLRISDQVPQIGLLLAVMLYQRSVEAGLYLALAAVTIGYSILEYLRFRYRLTDEALEITSGVLVRRERRIQLDRIHDLAQTRTLLRRVLGVVTVSVETASSVGAEAKLDALTPVQAQTLREAIERITALGKKGAPETVADETPLHRSRPFELLLLGATNNRAGLVVAALLLVLNTATEFGRERSAQGLIVLLRYLEQEGSRMGPVVAIAGAVFVFMALGWIVSAVLTWVKFAGFTLTERDGVFRRKYGLLTTQEQAVPRRYVQILRLEQSVLRRLVRLVVVRADNAGSALDPKARQTGVDVFIPATSRAAAEAIVPLVVPGVDPVAPYTRTSGTLWRRWTFRATVLAGAVAGTLLLRGDAGWRVVVAGTVLALLPTVALVAGLLAHRRLGFFVDSDARCLAVRFGILGIYRAWVPFDRVQCVTLYATPFDRFAKVRHLQLVVTGGATLRLGYVPVETAEQLRRTLMGEVGEAGEAETTSTHLPAPAWIG